MGRRFLGDRVEVLLPDTDIAQACWQAKVGDQFLDGVAGRS